MSEPPSSLHPVTPPGEVLTLRKRAKTWLTMVILSVVGIIVPPLIGVSGTVLGMVSAFDEIGRTGGGDPEALASDISGSLITTALGIIIALLFGILFIISLVFWLITLSKIKNSPNHPSA
ncbi:MAG: MotA/TolQ/ExbB proton channel family protein [Verrucomicrobiales bacterium]|jgi:cytochrome c oxidase assembly factor CtaG|nr:MotA/TolQ/ExbB proton channel family protein [Verrucomicrobiales bacterium]